MFGFPGHGPLLQELVEDIDERLWSCRCLANAEQTGELRSAFTNRLCEVQGLERMELLLTLWLRPGMSLVIEATSSATLEK